MSAEPRPVAPLQQSLMQENARLQQLVAQQQNLLNQRSEPILTAVIDALANVAQMAQQGHPGAQQLLAAWRRSVKLAEDASTGIVRASSVPGNGVPGPPA